jgi:response regulator of citrate/malate metabolism
MIRVLIVEDEPLAADAHIAYVGRVPGFVVGGWARTGVEAIKLLAENQIDLVLLDVYLPDTSGINVVRAMRAAGHPADVIIVTQARDLAVVRASVSYGIVHYLIKPFTFSTVRDRLDRYRAYHERLTGRNRAVAQEEIDRLLSTLRLTTPAGPPKGLSRESLQAAVAAVEGAPPGTGLSAAEVADLLGSSRVTARRYLEYLAEAGLAVRRTRYGGAHRPEVEYRWRRQQGHHPPVPDEHPRPLPPA